MYGLVFRMLGRGIDGILPQIDPQADVIHEDIEAAGRVIAQHLLARLAEPGATPTALQPAEVRFRD